MAGIALRFKNQIAFSKELEKFSDKVLPAAHVAVQKKIAIDLLSSIVEKNPVGNPTLWKNPSAAPPGYVGGRSRANWAISVSKPATTDNTVDPTGTDTTGAPIGGTQLAANFGEMAAAKFGGTIWIYNNVRYINRLEDGWSGQAPAGMVAISLAEIQAGLGSA